MKKFFWGLAIVSIIIFIYFLINYFSDMPLNIVNSVLMPVLIYLMGTFAAIVSSKFYKKNVSLIIKYIAVFFFSLVTLFTIFEDSNIDNAFTLFIVIAAIFNWNTEETNEEKKDRSSKNEIVYYLVNFIILFFIYTGVSMIFYRETSLQENVLSCIFIFAACFIFIYWMMYLFFRFVIKRNKITNIIKILFVLINGYLIYFFRDSIFSYEIMLLVSVCLIAAISITIQNLIINKV